MGHRRARDAEDRRLHVHNLGKQIRLARGLRQSNERKEPLSDFCPRVSPFQTRPIALRRIILTPRPKPTLSAKVLLDFARADVTFREITLTLRGRAARRFLTWV